VEGARICVLRWSGGFTIMTAVPRLLHLAWVSLLVGVLTGVTGTALAAVGGLEDCCSDCDEPGCPDHEGSTSCPTPCQGCICPVAHAPGVLPIVGSTFAAPVSRTPVPPAPLLAHDLARPSDVFRPPRLASR